MSYVPEPELNGKQETKLNFIVARGRVRQYNCMSLNCPIFATTTTRKLIGRLVVTEELRFDQIRWPAN